MAPLDLWVRVGLALERPLSVALSRDIEPSGPRDAGHLAAQELVLRLAAEHGRDGTFELPIGPIDRGWSADICLRDDPDRALGFIEIGTAWTTSALPSARPIARPTTRGCWLRSLAVTLGRTGST